ncbi:MAG: SDR family oxidoreductase [Lachnospiraceae bacterium]|nr:SDR family oxidoreductase [Lachnospiraceae bacterium]
MKRTAVVTGAAQGIGFAIARRLGQDGLNVAMADIKEDGIKEAAGKLTQEGIEAVPFVCDVSVPESLEKLMADTAERFGGIDVLVNNAGIIIPEEFDAITEAAWDKVLAVNLKGVYFGIKAALPYLRKSEMPRIINMASDAGRMGSHQSPMSYVASKGGIISLTYGLARRLAPEKIPINAICPGTIESPLFALAKPGQLDDLLSHIPMGRFGTPEDVAAGASFLASKDAEYITGHCLDINGGKFIH